MGDREGPVWQEFVLMHGGQRPLVRADGTLQHPQGRWLLRQFCVEWSLGEASMRCEARGGGWCEGNREGEEQKDRTLSSQRPGEDEELAIVVEGLKYFWEWELKFGSAKQTLVNTRIPYFWEEVLAMSSIFPF